ncbi:hypothetical protein EK21DRAFT_93952 [Setomelanomma holmii]|uniref:Uncharacterized protein n=1 Tax=Setomelanomma holmii TaxID=210430 RepID=A0A9P4LFK7_9PLEO|nr:hypothetical protein EK21DRAFT_93952 [Setomelanomma holmii]
MAQVIKHQSRPVVSTLLSHFDEQISDIIRKVLATSSGKTIFCRVAEECYKQAVTVTTVVPLTLASFMYAPTSCLRAPAPAAQRTVHDTTDFSGTLGADDYFDPLDEAALEWPYDSDFQSEEYYEHENRLDIHQDYAAAFREQEETRYETRRKERQNWTDFWAMVLNNSPDGPTLFYPSAGCTPEELYYDDMPRYLFRSFDRASSGRNDEGVIASTASLRPYAIYRRRLSGCHPLDIKICVVDTRNFPQGQFAQDLWLLKAYQKSANLLGHPVKAIFDRRLDREE